MMAAALHSSRNMFQSLKFKLKQRTIRVARSHGYEVTPIWRLKDQPLARHLRDLFSLYQIDCVLDVGGNLGQFRDLLRDAVGWEGLILSFEPVRKYVNHLRERCAIESTWHVFDFALGSEAGMATINVTRSPGLNSILSPRTDALPNFWSADAVLGTETIAIKTLDSVIRDLQAEHKFSRPYLKIDTQGFDLEVLKGARDFVSNVPALQTEMSIKPIYVGQPGFVELMEYFRAINFEPSALFPVNHDSAMRLIEFDCIVVNRRFAEDGLRVQ